MRPLQTRFPCGSGPVALNLAPVRNSPARTTKSTRPQLPTKLLPLFVGIRFQVLFHSPPGVLFTFPSRYLCTIGRQGVFSLGRWASQLPTGLLGPRGTRDSAREHAHVFGYGPVTLSGPAFQPVRLTLTALTSPLAWRPALPSTPAQQRCQASSLYGFGLFPVRSPLLGKSLACFLFLRVLRCFSSPGITGSAYLFGPSLLLNYQQQVAPLGYLRI